MQPKFKDSTNPPPIEIAVDMSQQCSIYESSEGLTVEKSMG